MLRFSFDFLCENIIQPFHDLLFLFEMPKVFSDDISDHIKDLHLLVGHESHVEDHQCQFALFVSIDMPINKISFGYLLVAFIARHVLHHGQQRIVLAVWSSFTVLLNGLFQNFFLWFIWVWAVMRLWIIGNHSWMIILILIIFDDFILLFVVCHRDILEHKSVFLIGQHVIEWNSCHCFISRWCFHHLLYSFLGNSFDSISLS